MSNTALVRGTLVLAILVTVAGGLRTFSAQVVPVSCTDSDGGQEFRVAGTVTVQKGEVTESFDDSCSNTRLLFEYVCSPNNQVLQVDIDCPAGCSGGACVDADQFSCTDSDEGSVHDVAGTVSGVWNGEPYSFQEHCVGEKELMEFRCDGPLATPETMDGSPVTCLNLCRDGACVGASEPSFTCEDSDGRDVLRAGRVTGVWNATPYTFEDRCLDGHWLGEAICDGNQAGFYRTDDPRGVECEFGCRDGACLTEPQGKEYGCEDADGRVRATWRYNLYEYADHCGEDGSLVDYFCEGDEAKNATVPCPRGCADGVCAGGAQASCTDTDGGLNVAERGTVTADTNGQLVTYADECADADRLVEYACEGSALESFPFSCDNGCRDGACL